MQMFRHVPLQEKLDYLGQTLKGGLKSALMDVGEQCVTTYGVAEMLKWLADNLDFRVSVLIKEGALLGQFSMVSVGIVKPS